MTCPACPHGASDHERIGPAIVCKHGCGCAAFVNETPDVIGWQPPQSGLILPASVYEMWQEMACGKPDPLPLPPAHHDDAVMGIQHLIEGTGDLQPAVPKGPLSDVYDAMLGKTMGYAAKIHQAFATGTDPQPTTPFRPRGRGYNVPPEEECVFCLHPAGVHRWGRWERECGYLEAGQCYHEGGECACIGFARPVGVEIL